MESFFFCPQPRQPPPEDLILCHDNRRKFNSLSLFLASVCVGLAVGAVKAYSPPNSLFPLGPLTFGAGVREKKGGSKIFRAAPTGKTRWKIGGWVCGKGGKKKHSPLLLFLLLDRLAKLTSTDVHSSSKEGRLRRQSPGKIETRYQFRRIKEEGERLLGNWHW